MSQSEPTHQVVRNDEGQYSVWPTEHEPPRGWRVEGFSGSRDDCLAHVEQVWTDLRPVSLRERMGPS
ncbi:MbtH family NRPS accessory protein [Micromonospora sp. PSH03]|jgi:MbtH protein|uniref:MbtH family protein n=1 Tax=Micromonospora TaxID=1873 RepID=UPI001B35D9CD|nr:MULTISPECIES: MbtH family NRPS accessory protein [Micromonospora]MBQ0988748.1 MbtH family NRPS accessory protein [Micromonospora sp. H61]MCG5454703.1 MbtH family NRPS accessory protein [Micromonospora salmantinae]